MSLCFLSCDWLLSGSPRLAPPLRHAGVSCLCRCSAEREGERTETKRDCAKQPPPTPPLREMGLRVMSKARSSCIVGASEATQLWRKGKTRNIDRKIKNSTDRESGCFAVRERCGSICDTPTHYVSMGSKNGGGVGAEEEMDAHICTVMEDITVAFAGLSL